MGALNENFIRRSRRVRHTLKRAANGRVRLSVFRSSKHIYAQVIDDRAGKTVAAASTLDKDLKGASAQGQRPRGGAAVGKLVAERALQAGVKDVSSIAAVISIMGASRRSPRPPARPA